jgi:hypothetical protein
VTCAEAVRLYLLSLSPVTALVSGRVFTFRFPQSPTKPAVLVTQISDVHDPHLRGTSALRRDRIQVDVIANTIAEARAVDQAILGTFTAGAATGLQGIVTEIGSPAATLGPVFPGNYREMYDGDELKQARVMRDYMAAFSE